MATMHALVVPQHPTLRCRTPKQPLTRCQNSNNVTRTEALAELQALRAGLGKHLAATETALQQSAAVSTCTAEALVEITTPNNDLHEISASQFDELIATAGDTVVMVKFTSSKCGPCKLMLPKLVSMRDEYPNTHFVKGEQVAFVTGTKEQELRQVLDAHQ